jgi:hypothetical protein
VFNVDNDTLNTVLVREPIRMLHQFLTGPLSIEMGSNIAGNTPSGSYSITYQYGRQSINRIEFVPANCSARYNSSFKSIDAVDDPSVTVVSNNAGSNGINALTNDTLNGLQRYDQYQCNAINDRTIEH